MKGPTESDLASALASGNPPIFEGHGGGLNWRIKTPAQLEFLGPSQVNLFLQKRNIKVSIHDKILFFLSIFQCGKSTKVLKLVSEANRIFDKEINQIIYASPSAQSLDHGYLKELRDICKESNKRLALFERIPLIREVRDIYPTGQIILILDDLTCFEDLSSLTALGSLYAHHACITCVYCIQNPFQRSARCDLTTLNRNLTGRFVFYQRNDYYVYRALNMSIFPDRKNFLMRCLNTAKEELGLNYVYIDSHCYSDVPRRFQCFTGLFLNELPDKIPYQGPLFFDMKSGHHGGRDWE